MFQELISKFIAFFISIFVAMGFPGCGESDGDRTNNSTYTDIVSYSGEWKSDEMTAVIDRASIRIFDGDSLKYSGTFKNPSEDTTDYEFESKSANGSLDLDFSNDEMSLTLDGKSLTFTKQQPVMRFIAMSDIHVKDTRTCIQLKRFKAAINDMYRYSEGQSYTPIDALIIDGDFANNGKPKQMRYLRDAIDDVVKDETEVHLTLASHEFGYGGVNTAEKNLKKYFSQAPDEHFTVGGFDFITVSCDLDGCGFSNKKQSFARDELSKASQNSASKPIFFFQHPHIKNTVYGSIGWGNDYLTDILSAYPEVIDFSGHSHAPVNDPRNVYQKDFTSLGTGSLSYTELDEFDKYYGTVPDDKDTFAQFLLCEVTEDGTVLARAYDVLSTSFFDSDVVIYRPGDKSLYTYTDARFTNPEIPEFSPDAKVTVKTSMTKITVTFDQAMTKTERPNSYYVTLTDKNGKKLDEKSFWSSYYIKNMPATKSVEFTKPVGIGEVTVTVRAKGYWENFSSNVLTTTVKL